ncbi:MAG: hypothetical protein FWE61_05045 [Micrococcales bacterium]|nr:hypothetical protein [Micrococcales bacterium]
MRRSALLVIPLLAIALLAGCNQGDQPNNITTPGKGSDFGHSGDKGNNGNNGENNNVGDLESCIVGTWNADADALATMGTDMAEMDVLGDGLTVLFKMKAAHTFEVVMEASEVAMTMTMSGTWSVSGSDRLYMIMQDVTAEVMGQRLTAADLEMDLPQRSTATAKCASRTLEMRDPGGEPYTLTRQ